MAARSIVLPVGLAAAASLVASSPSPAQEGEELFAEACAHCHSPAGTGRAPGAGVLGQLSPRAIVASLEDGVMRAEGSNLTPEQRIHLAEYLTSRRYTATALPEAVFCGGPAWTAPVPADVSWMGFAGNLAGTGFQSPERAGLDASDVPNLELRWAFAFPDGTNMRTSPAVAGDVAIVAGPFGEVAALDLATGCVRWSYEADAPVRGAIVVGAGAEGRSTAWFVDSRTNAYAVDPESGSLQWRQRIGWHAAAYGTGSPALHDGRLFVPVSSLEVALAGDPRYECCTSSGAVAALDAATGDVLWYHRVIPGYPEETGRNGIGTTSWGPSGAAVWSSPTIDPARGLLYAGTGENLTHPATGTSDAILALELETGELVWSFQGTSGDAFNTACTQPAYRENCPDPPGPDLDFGMAPMLVTRPDGREILVAGQKSGVVRALDPDDNGALLWSTRVGKGSALGGIHWGMATDGRYAYAPNSDRNAVVLDVNPERRLSPGLYALDLMTGEVVWSATPPEDACRGKPRCFAANSAAVTAIDGVVFAGGLDGVIRAHATVDGRVIWEFDTTRPVETVGGVPGRGGSIDGPGPVVAGGMLFVNSGYGMFGQMPGNLLLAFEAASGKPDLNGLWQALGNAHWDIEPHAARAALAMQPGPVIPVPANEVLALGAVGSVPSGYGVVEGGVIPYLPEALALRDENRERWLERDPEIKCYLPGVPRATYMPFPFRIFQSETRVFIAYEYAGAMREIYLEDPGPPQVDAWMGQSVGRWEGDTFVVEVNGFNGRTWFDRAGNHHSAGLEVTERYTPTGPDHIRYEAVIDDPATFSRPWTIRMPLYRNIDPDARLGQFKCVEFVEELMYGHLRKNPIR